MSRAAPSQVPAAVLGGTSAGIIAALRVQSSLVRCFAESDPLHGVLAASRWAGAMGFAFVATVPVDAPFVPGDLLARMTPLAQYGRIVVLSDGERLHPTVGLWPTALAACLQADLTRGPCTALDWSRKAGRIEVLYLRGADGLFPGGDTRAFRDRRRGMPDAAE